MAEICYNTDCPYNKWYQCERTCTCITQLTDGHWYHGNGKIGGEFHPNKPDDKERYGEYVKIVRCKDCVNFHKYGFKLEYTECKHFDCDVCEDGFCAWGERTDEVEE